MSARVHAGNVRGSFSIPSLTRRHLSAASEENLQRGDMDAKACLIHDRDMPLPSSMCVRCFLLNSKSSSQVSLSPFGFLPSLLSACLQ